MEIPEGFDSPANYVNMDRIHRIVVSIPRELCADIASPIGLLDACYFDTPHLLPQ